ncbi:hypothetical protein J6590_068417 [Homalodisca vitripennis]|nr:hypothetical protein J6590_068417 [Homalodisca vitripennis]
MDLYLQEHKVFSSRWSASVPRGLQAGRTDATRCRKGFTSLPVNNVIRRKTPQQSNYEL